MKKNYLQILGLVLLILGCIGYFIIAGYFLWLGLIASIIFLTQKNKGPKNISNIYFYIGIIFIIVFIVLLFGSF